MAFTGLFWGSCCQPVSRPGRRRPGLPPAAGRSAPRHHGAHGIARPWGEQRRARAEPRGAGLGMAERGWGRAEPGQGGKSPGCSSGFVPSVPNRGGRWGWGCSGGMQGGAHSVGLVRGVCSSLLISLCSPKPSCTPVSGGLLAGCSVCAHGAAGRAGCLPGVRGDLRWPGVTRGHPCSTQEDIWDLTVTRCVGATPHLGMALRGGLRGFHLGGAAWPPPFPPGRRAAGEGRGVLPACPHLRQHQPGSARFWGTALHPLPAAQAGTEPPVTSRLG